jgi:dethiobiotin synthetase
MHGLFITATDTDVGKTYVTALIARQLRAEGKRVGIYKPVCSGAGTTSEGELFWADVETHFDALDGQFERERICPQCFQAPAAPPVAARLENQSVNTRLLQDGFDWWSAQVDILLVEGVGGFLCPLTETEYVADFATDIKLPVAVVAPRGLGAINQTLLTIEAIRHRGLIPAGIVLNQHIAPENSIAEITNPSELGQRTDVPILACLQFEQRDELRDPIEQRKIDWEGLARLTPV